MAKAKELTYEELIAYAKKHYTKGGDSVYECWDERTYNEYVELFGPITKKKALEMFRISYDVDRDRAGFIGDTDFTDCEEAETASGCETYEEYWSSEEDLHYTPCSSNGDYGPGNPWDAPGMSVRDFI